ncbi:GNAT family N-acetyltransferase [Vibrio sp. T187]|uniref:GNAT family N-acetyltransferase n=1 Tax=Vibrio TaxID=662 RepID=UPI0010C9A127|nr:MULTISPECIES: GNAT family N-acetyltransferase [Vibrio]MBW3694988.1 GNAT family N-acetyltransferase [Vibrio sp. T187]
MLVIEKYSVARESEAAGLSVKPEQAQFTVNDVGQYVAQLSEQEHPHLIIFNQQVVGFFLLDLGYASKYDFCSEGTIGIRGLLVDQRFQGKGIAKQFIAKLPSYVQHYYPHCDLLQLTVNCRNKAAFDCYLKGGFEDTGELYLGGPVGPQHIMKKSI